MRRRGGWKVQAAYLAAALLGTLAAMLIVKWRYDVEVARVRRVHPQAWVCGYDYRQMAMLVAPLGAMVAISLLEAIRSRKRRP